MAPQLRVSPLSTWRPHAAWTGASPAGLLVAAGARGTWPVPLPSLQNCLNDSFFQCACSLPHTGARSGLRAVARGRFLQRPEAGLAGGPGCTSRPGYLTLWVKGHWPHWLKAEGTLGTLPLDRRPGTRRRERCPACSPGGGQQGCDRRKVR